MNQIQNLEASPYPGGFYVRYRPGGTDHILFIWQRPAKGKCAGITRYLADTAGQWSSQQLANDGSKLTFAGNQWPYTQVQASAQGSPWNAANGPAAILQANGLPSGIYDCALVALAAVGPMPFQTQYADNAAGYSSRINAVDANCDTAHGACQLGSNMGCFQAADAAGIDFCIINGQGADATANPAIVDVSTFSVSVPAMSALTAGGDQQFEDDFATEPQFGARININAVAGSFDQVMTTVAGAWDVYGRQCDLNNTEAFWDAGHVMGVLFEGGTQGSNIPPHDNFAALSWSPQRGFDFSGGRILHLVSYIDAQSTSRRYPSFALAPASDPLTAFNFQEGVQVNATETALFVEIENAIDVTNELQGPTVNLAVTGAAGQATNGGYFKLAGNQFTLPPDCRNRFDLFCDGKRLALYMNGALVSDVVMAQPLTFAQARVYVTGWSYHTAIDVNPLPFEQIYPHSDERHIGPVAVEVLPATAWSALPVPQMAWSAVGASAKTWPAFAGTLLDAVKAFAAAVGGVVPPVATPSFTLSAPPVSVPAGGSASATVLETPAGGFSGVVALSVANLPAGLSVAVQGNSVAFTAAPTLAPGVYPVQITGMAGTLSASATCAVTVVAAAPAPDPLQGALDAANAQIAADNTEIAAIKAKIAKAQGDLQ